VNEERLTSAFARIFAPNKSQKRELLTPIGDDGAVLRRSNADQVLVADVAVAGVHFNRQWSSPAEIGARVIVANLADLYAMGAKPKYLLATLVADPEISDQEILAIARGMKKEADRAGALIVGGDLSRGNALTISVSGFGELKRKVPTERSGAQVGDRIFLSGPVGGSRLGLLAYQEQEKRTGRKSNSSGLVLNNFEITKNEREKFKKIFRLPQPDYKMMEQSFTLPINSAIDISDGLISEVRRVTAASAVSAELDLTALYAAPLFRRLAIKAERDLTSIFLESGEEHVLLATSSRTLPGWLEIGKILPRKKGETSQIWVDGKKLRKSDFPGFRHH
jgi:thiamine-monophosphate kinase